MTSMINQMVVMGSADLEAIFTKAIEDAIKRVQAQRDNAEWLTTSDLTKRYKIGKKALGNLIATGKLPATIRRFPGGRDGWVVRSSDAERVLGVK